MDQAIDQQEQALRRAIQTLSQSDPLLKLLDQVRLRRMKPSDAGLRAVTESWLHTYRQVLSSEAFNDGALRRLNPEPRLAVLIDAGILAGNHAGLAELTSLYEVRLATAAK